MSRRLFLIVAAEPPDFGSILACSLVLGSPLI